MSTLELLKLERQAKQIQRKFESLQRQYQSGGSSSNVDISTIRSKLLEIRKQTERELGAKDDSIRQLNQVVSNARTSLIQIREQVVRESRENSDRIFREHITKELRSIRDDVVGYENQKQQTILKLNEIRQQIVKDNNERISLKEQVSTLNSQLQAKQNTIDSTYRAVANIKRTIIRESANTTPTVFRSHILKTLKDIRSQVVTLQNENKRLRRGNTQMNGIEETKEDDLNLPTNPPNRIPSSRRIESSDDNIKTQLDLTYFTSYICPWSMRVWLTLLFKNMDYELKYVSLDNKSQEFTTAYRKADNCVPTSTGQVPLIRHDDFYLCESGPLVNYLDSLSNRNLIRRSNQRDQIYVDITCNWANNWVAKYYYSMLKCPSDEERVKLGQEFIEKCGELNKRLSGLRQNNPFLLGNTPSTFYFYFFPFFDRMPIIESFYGAKRSLRFNDIFNNNSNLKRWYDAAMSLPATVTAHERIRKRENMEPLQYYKKGYTGYIPQGVKVN